MPNPVLADLVAEITRNRQVDSSATALLNGIEARIKAAVDKALENGATEAELQPLRQLHTDLKNSNDELSAAITANTPSAGGGTGGGGEGGTGGQTPPTGDPTAPNPNDPNAPVPNPAGTGTMRAGDAPKPGQPSKRFP